MKKKFLSLTLVFALLFSSFTYGNFSDVAKASDWALSAIEKFNQLDIVEGFPDGRFDPLGNVTRAQFAKMSAEAYQLEERQYVSFSDVSEDAWYAQHVITMASYGYIVGDQGMFRPNDSITRAEAAVILSRINGLTPNAEAAKIYDDFEEFPQWAVGHIGAAYEAEIMNGTGSSFRWNDHLTREQSVVVLDRAIYGKNIFAAEYWKLNLPGEYGGTSSNIEKIQGDVYIQSPDVKLSYVEIQGDLILGREILEGDADIHGVVVKGETRIEGGGENSINFVDSTLGRVVVNKARGLVRVVFAGNTTVDTVQVKSAVNVDSSELGEGGSIKELIIEEDAEGDIVLTGRFVNVVVNSPRVNIIVSKDTVIEQLTMSETAKGSTLKNDGEIKKVENKAGVEIGGTGRVDTGTTPAPAPPAPTPVPPAPTPVPPTSTYVFQAWVQGVEVVVEGKELHNKWVYVGERTVRDDAKLSPSHLEEILKSKYAQETEDGVVGDEFNHLIVQMLTKESGDKGHSYAYGMANRIKNYKGLEVLDYEDANVKALVDAILDEVDEVKAVKDFAKYLSEQDMMKVLADLDTLYGEDTVGSLVVTLKGHDKEIETFGDLKEVLETELVKHSYASLVHTDDNDKGAFLTLKAQGITLSFRITK